MEGAADRLDSSRSHHGSARTKARPAPRLGQGCSTQYLPLPPPEPEPELPSLRLCERQALLLTVPRILKSATPAELISLAAAHGDGLSGPPVRHLARGLLAEPQPTNNYFHMVSCR